MKHTKSSQDKKVADLEAVQVGVEDISVLNAGDQSHGQLLIGLISDVHCCSHVYRQTIHT